MKIKFIFTFLLVIAITGCTQVSTKKENLSFDKIPEAINLNTLAKGGLVVLNKQTLPLDTNGIIKEIRIDLPDYSQGVFFRPFTYTTASGNRIEPVYFRNLSDLVHFKKTVPKEGDSMEMGTFLLLKKPNGTYFVVLPIVSNQIGNTLKVDKKSFYLECATYGTKAVSCVAPLFAYAESKNPYEAAHLAWDKAKNAPNVKGNVNWRSDKTFPEPYTYLGWCSWEHFRTNINEPIILNAIHDIKSSKIPFRWVLIDDGYLDQTDHKLLSFGVDKKKFPNGWDPIAKQKDDKIKWLGIWRNFNGYMRGISKNHTMTNLTKDITEVKSSKDSKYM